MGLDLRQTCPTVSFLAGGMIAAWPRETMTSGKSIMTPVHIPFGNFVGFFKKCASRNFVGRCGRVYQIHEARRNIRFVIEFGCSTM